MSTYQTQIGPDLHTAADWLKAGTCVAIPTETVYGLAANALDPAAVVQIFEIKNRPAFDPLIVHVSGLEQAEQLTRNIPAPLRQLAEHFWPGPLTILAPRRNTIPDLVTSGLPDVALRAPAHPLAQALLQELPFPLAAPSANPFGYISPTTAQHVFDQLQGKIPYILDGGPCHVGVESTIVGFVNGEITIYRLGGLALENIEAVVGSVQTQLIQSSNPAAPGMLKSHYAPRKPLLDGGRWTVDGGRWMVDGGWWTVDGGRWTVDGRRPRGTRPTALSRRTGANPQIGILTFMWRTDLPEHALQIALSKSGNLTEAAQNLFAALRALDQANIDLILAERFPDEGLGRAINDRLQRAAAARDAS